MGNNTLSAISAAASTLQFGFVSFTHDDAWELLDWLIGTVGSLGVRGWICLRLRILLQFSTHSDDSCGPAHFWCACALTLFHCLQCALSSTSTHGVSRVCYCYCSSFLGWRGIIWILACLVTFLPTNGTVITLHSFINVAVTPFFGPTWYVLSAEALEFSVCTHLELLNVSVHLSLNKDSSDGMNLRNKDVSDSFLSDSFFFGSYDGNLVLEDFKISQSLAEFQNNVSVVCLSMILYS